MVLYIGRIPSRNDVEPTAPSKSSWSKFPDFMNRNFWAMLAFAYALKYLEAIQSENDVNEVLYTIFFFLALITHYVRKSSKNRSIKIKGDVWISKKHQDEQWTRIKKEHLNKEDKA